MPPRVVRIIPQFSVALACLILAVTGAAQEPAERGPSANVPAAPAKAPDPAQPQDQPPAAPSQSLTQPQRGLQAQAPPRPKDDRASRAYAVLEAHCARCHQSGFTTTPLPSGGFGDILDLPRVASDPSLVRRAMPDASRLFDVLVTRHSPLEVYPQSGFGAEPDPDEIQAVRDWIRALPEANPSCAGRKPVTRVGLSALVREAQRIEREGAGELRFASLAHLYNDCVPEDTLAGYRQALAKALNGASRAASPVKLEALDPEQLIFPVRLGDFGWTSAEWELLANAAPATPAAPWPDDIRSHALTQLPVAPADWLVATASEPPIYYALLGLPPTLAEIGRAFGVEIDQNIRLGVARRAAVGTSVVTRANRIVERHAGARGAFWLAYDFATGTGEQNVFDHPLGPPSATLAAGSFRPDMVRAAFALPNGFFAYALFDASGNRIDRALPGLEKPYTGTEALAPEPGTKAGANCQACHVGGVIAFEDAFRTHATAEPSLLSPTVRDAALPLFPVQSEMALLIAGDVERHRNALSSAGVDPDLRVGGDEPVTALVRRYRRPVGFESALAETGLLRDAFVIQLAEATGPAASLTRRLQQGVLPRADLTRLYALLRGGAAKTAPASGGFLRDVETEIGLSLWIDPPQPRAGDLVRITAESDADCYLTIIGVDSKSKATVLFPNDFEAENLARAGKPVTVPAAEAPYQLRFKALGPETILARCSTSSKPPMGIEHDFERQKFTLLGNWDIFIQDTLITESELRLNPDKARRAATARADARRRTGPRVISDAPPPDTMPGLILKDGRAALAIDPK